MTPAGGLVVFDAAAVAARLDLDSARAEVSRAMIALSSGRVRQLLRSFIPLEPGRTFALMPAAFDGREVFGAKLVSVFAQDGGKAHQGLVVLFDGETGAPVCVADAGEVTALRTAAMSAVATEALARPDARTLAILGMGRQALEHARAIARARRLDEIRLSGRDMARAQVAAARIEAAAGVPCRVFSNPERAVDGADIVCTTTTASDPVLFGRWLSPGAHVNAVGSSSPDHAEIDDDLVAQSRFIVDHREHALAHGGELIRAIASGAVGPDHIAAEIGQVLAGDAPGRTSPGEITVFKSLGHAVQDLAVTAWLWEHAR